MYNVLRRAILVKDDLNKDDIHLSNLVWSILKFCINSKFRQILSLCHCQVLLFKRSFLLILYFPGGGGAGPLWNSQGGHPLCTPLTPLYTPPWYNIFKCCRTLSSDLLEYSAKEPDQDDSEVFYDKTHQAEK